MLRIHNSLSGKTELFKPRAGNTVKLYTCGPTVYSRPHIGNYRTYVWEDTLKRRLLSTGYFVRHAMNITDFDNTILREVKKTGVPRKKMTKKYERLFRQDLRALGAIPAGRYPHASDYTGKMASCVIALLKNGAAYEDKRGRVFFDVSKFKTYGKLVGKNLSRASRKVLWEEYRPSQAGDFLIWQPCGGGRSRNRGKGRNGGFPDCFDSPLGLARPPWNIQCAVMSTECLGREIDIAMGGTDNKFNHHENTRAIVGALSHCEYAKYWVHVRHLIINGSKMSKRKGNSVLLPDMARRGFSPLETRFILLSVHYGERLDFTWAYARKMKGKREELAACISKMKKAKGAPNPRFNRLLPAAKIYFEKAMDNDLNAPQAFAAIEKFALACAGQGLSAQQSRAALSFLKKCDRVLACLPL